MPSSALDFSMEELVGIAHRAAGDLDSPLLEAVEVGKRVRVRARGISSAPAPMLPVEGFGYWCGALRWRTTHSFDAVVLVTGAVGTGKSTLAMRMAQAIDPTFSIEERLCYTAAELLRIYQTIQPGQVVLFDEGVRGLLAGDQMTTEQKALIQALALVREKNAILFICAPSIWNVAKQVRQNRAYMWVHVMGRGLAKVHDRNERLHYLPDATLGFDISRECPFLQWTAYAPTSRFFIEYKTVKTKHLDDYLLETRNLLEKGKRGPKGTSVLNKKIADEIDRRLKAGESWPDIAADIQGRGTRDAPVPLPSPIVPRPIPAPSPEEPEESADHDEVDEKILSMLKRGSSYGDIIKRFRVSAHRIARIKKSAGLD